MEKWVIKLDFGTLMIFILFLFIDLILIYKPIPILSFPVMVFFIFIGVTEFLPLADTVLPFNPITTFFFLLFCSFGMLVNALDLKG